MERQSSGGRCCDSRRSLTLVSFAALLVSIELATNKNPNEKYTKPSIFTWADISTIYGMWRERRPRRLGSSHSLGPGEILLNDSIHMKYTVGCGQCVTSRHYIMNKKVLPTKRFEPFYNRISSFILNLVFKNQI